MRSARAAALLCCLLLGCACSSPRRPQLYLSHFGLTQPQIEAFETCASFGCRKRTQLAYSASEWHSLAAIFQPPAASPAEERQRLLIAIAAMETLVGAKNGTAGDLPKNQRRGSNSAQLDCIAEAANTTVALLLLEQNGLMRHHYVGYPQHRGIAQGCFPHNSAAIVERESGEVFAVDAWFYANGKPPVCVPLHTWKAGYAPSSSDD